MKNGQRIYGLASLLLGLIGLAWGDFALVWQPVPETLPGRAGLAYGVGAALTVAGVAANLRAVAAFGAAALAVLYLLGVLLLPQLAMPSDIAAGVYRGEASEYSDSEENLRNVTTQSDMVFAASSAAQLALQTPALSGSAHSGDTGRATIAVA